MRHRWEVPRCELPENRVLLHVMGSRDIPGYHGASEGMKDLRLECTSR